MRNISQANLLSVTIPLADPGEQRRAIARLNELTAGSHQLQKTLEDNRRRSAALRRALLTAAFSGRLTGRTSDIDRVEEMAGV